jgi:hypothetical protein
MILAWTTTSKAELPSNKPMYVGEFKSLFSLSYSSMNSSQSRGMPAHVLNGKTKYQNQWLV